MLKTVVMEDFPSSFFDEQSLKEHNLFKIVFVAL